MPTSMATALSSSFTYILLSLPQLLVPYHNAGFIPFRQSCLPELAHYARLISSFFLSGNLNFWLIRSSLVAYAKLPLLYLAYLQLACCPKTHFGGNQLPDCSIGLSPLCQVAAIDLHIRTAYCFQLSFVSLHRLLA